jgi:hypothetical protein
MNTTFGYSEGVSGQREGEREGDWEGYGEVEEPAESLYFYLVL